MLRQLKLGVGAHRQRRNSHSWAPAVEQLEDRQLLSNSFGPQLFEPSEIRAHYGVNDIKFSYYTTITLPGGGIGIGRVTVPGDGKGQTIAIIDKYYDPNINNDVAVFDQQYSLPAINLTVDRLPSATTTQASGAWESEESADVEWAHAIAPGANIVVVNCGTTLTDTLNAINAAKNYPGVSVVSMSLSGSEFQGELADDAYFNNPSNHNGVNVSFVASSGDDKGPPGAEWPGVSPNVLSVGGTNLIPLTSGGYQEQSAQFSQGGPSVQEPEPLYQYSVQRSGFRETPDVSYNAVDYAYYDSFSTSTAPAPGWARVGGTSLGAPQWAALIAIANQGRVLDGDSTLGGFAPAAIYAAPSTDFNDITTGPANAEGYSPGPGYDEITGRGSPKANLLVPDLVNYTHHIVIHPNPIGGSTTGSNMMVQVAPAPVALGSSLVSPANADALDGLTVGNSSRAPATSAASGSDQWTSWSLGATQTPSLGDHSSLPHSGAVTRLNLRDGSSGDSNTALNNPDNIQWAGLIAALDALSA